MATLNNLKAGYQITVTAGATRACVQNADGSVAAFIPSTFSQVFGPYLVDRAFLVSDDATVSVAAYTTSIGGLLMSNAGAPADGVAATVNVNPAGDDNGLTYTARTYGAAGNNISVRYVDPAANSQSIAVSVVGTAITVSLATNGGGTITSTAAQVKTAIEANATATNLVSVAIMTSDSGTADDGSGVVTAMALTALASGAGTGIGLASPGGICIDTTNSDIYRNDGSTAAPVWVKVGDAP
jgi:hypothetical protein